MNPARSVTQSGRTGVIISLILAAGAAAWLGFRYVELTSAVPERATVLPEGKPLPEFSLTDHRGRAAHRDSLAGRWHLAFFGFTHCPDVCPVTLGQLAMVRRQLASDGPGGPLPDILFISVDPERDTPPAMRQYLSPFGEGTTGLTGDPAELARVAAALGIYYARGEPVGETGYSVDHTAAVLLLDPQVELRAIFSAPHEAGAIARDVALLMDRG